MSLNPSCSNLTWTSDDHSETFILEYPNISIHAICRDTSSFPHECVYLLHSPPVESGGEEEEEEEEEEGEEEVEEKRGGSMEIRLVPPNLTQCKSPLCTSNWS